jgi:undecaprenyl-diphosphatase
MEPTLDWMQVFWLAIIQGITEFLPVSSSGHLILAPNIFGWADQGLAFDVAVHIGSLLAVIIYFRRDIFLMGRDWTLSLVQRRSSQNSRLAWAVIWATIPAVLAGLVVNSSGLEDTLRNPLIIASTTIIFGALLWWADIKGRGQRDEYTLTRSDIVVIGLAQALALIPGTSRSGITLTAGLMMGLNRKAAARFSFLLSLPLILGAGLLKTKDLLELSEPVHWDILLGGAIISFISAYLVIDLFLKWINRIGMMPFALYRFALGLLLFYWFW